MTILIFLYIVISLIQFEGESLLEEKSLIKLRSESGEEFELVLAKSNTPKLVVCDVCGHRNSLENELCEKCSNYLKG